MWNARDFGLLKTLVGHEGKVSGFASEELLCERIQVMDLDIGRDEGKFVSCSYDKTWKVWCHQ